MNSQLDIDQHDYNFSGTIYDDSTDNAPSTDDEQVLNEKLIFPSASTRHSSVSSFPASVVHHTPIYDRPETPSRSPYQYARSATPNQSPRPHSTGFRHPSSVRALQMRDEFESTDCEELTPGHRRRNSKLSYISYRSSGSHHSSPTKSYRMSRSAHNSPSKSKLKQEFPLVLLHCTLLPPAIHARAKDLKSEAGDKDSLLEAIIPEPYVKQWKTLQEKVVKNGEVKLRGILIPHPKDDYDLLEERLLESLELERPRIREGHYLGSEKVETAHDSGFESAGTDSESQHDGQNNTNDVGPSTKCPDCGHQLSEGVEQERKWEVKVFAANGLMRAGAWEAAWNEMEKVDVEVSIWMPENIRREVDERLEALIAKELETKPKRDRRNRGMDHERAKEIYGEQLEDNVEGNRPSQAEIDGLIDTNKASSRPQDHHPQAYPHHPPDLSTLILRSVQVLAQDRRNIAILLLSILVLFYGISNGRLDSTPKRVDVKVSNVSVVPATSVERALINASGTSSIETEASASMVPETSLENNPPEATTGPPDLQNPILGEVMPPHTTDEEDKSHLDGDQSTNTETETETEATLIGNYVANDGLSPNGDFANDNDIQDSQQDAEQSHDVHSIEEDHAGPEGQEAIDDRDYDEL